MGERMPFRHQRSERAGSRSDVAQGRRRILEAGTVKGRAEIGGAQPTLGDAERSGFGATERGMTQGHRELVRLDRHAPVNPEWAPRQQSPCG